MVELGLTEAEWEDLGREIALEKAASWAERDTAIPDEHEPAPPPSISVSRLKFSGNPMRPGHASP